MDIVKVFGSNLKKYRTAMGISQEAFADKCGMHRTYISAIECYRRSISLENIQRIADALEIETYKLFMEEWYIIEKIKNILHRKGKNNPITSAEIATRVGIVKGRYKRKRLLILECDKKIRITFDCE